MTATQETTEQQQRMRGQFAALGWFIQTFEKIVALLRSDCSAVIRGSQRGITCDMTAPGVTLAHWRISDIVFSHEIMTARPLLELWRALTFENTKAISKLSEDGCAVVLAIQNQIAKDFTFLIEQRNQIIHATWRIGYPSHDADLEKIVVYKNKISRTGITERNDLPQSAEELSALCGKCDEIWGLMARLSQFLTYHPDRIAEVFKSTDGRWSWINPDRAGDGTLPPSR
ncbi:MAG: hypothetical protein KGL39_54720 [Patescibacteria group bacterium]|nr:hypothetical protein [Patescibacteria group bacterium]